MIITKETKERFVEMLGKKQIVVVWCSVSRNSRNNNYKIIGVQNGLKWDFTPAIVDATDCKTNGCNGRAIAARSYSGAYLIELALKKFKEEGIKVPEELLSSTNDYLCFFGM